MSDAVQTDPHTAGVYTSEHGFAKWASILSATVVAGGIVLAGVASTLTSLHGAFPTAGWITAAVGIVGGVAGFVGTVASYVGGRSDVKVAIENTKAAQTMAGVPGAAALAALQRPSNPASSGTVAVQRP